MNQFKIVDAKVKSGLAADGKKPVEKRDADRKDDWSGILKSIKSLNNNIGK